jgi:hypothetical protein
VIDQRPRLSGLAVHPDSTDLEDLLKPRPIATNGLVQHGAKGVSLDDVDADARCLSGWTQ